ncbi:MAG TPA: hypothetical protein VID72_04520 [Ktedonobacterales bacterium]|jgi:hypothetical protein
MSHDERSERDTAEGQPAGEEATTLSAWLRALAKRAESDAAFAAQMLDAARESGLSSALDSAAVQQPPQAAAHPSTRSRKAAPAPPAPAGAAPDPFAVYRTQGVEGLRAALDALDLPTLRAIVRERRLDPARISARWTARERVISLIVDQVKARANHGQAFRRV